MDYKQLDKVVKETLSIIEKGKNQIYDIAEYAKIEFERLTHELENVKKETKAVIAQVDILVEKEKSARLKLAQVSENFNKHNEKDIKKAYEKAQELQVSLLVVKEQEKQLRLRRDQLEISLKRNELTVQKAESIMTHVGVAFQYLQENINGIAPKIEELQQQHNLGIRVIKAQEEERRRVAREIHDGPAQLLANIVLRVEICQKLIQISEMAKVQEELNGIKDSVRNSLQDVRKIIFDLRPMTLDDLGLVPAIRKHIENTERRFYGDILFKYIGEEQRYDSNVELAVFRICQEAINNAVKHADARTIDVKLEMRSDKVVLLVSDDGKGYDIDAVIAKKDRDNFGLISMRERAELLKGQVKLTSVINTGSEVYVHIPVKGRDSSCLN